MHKSYVENDFLIFEDSGLGVSVTNSIESLIKNAETQFNIRHQNFKIIYKDSMGFWDGVILGPSLKFIALRCLTKEDAKKNMIVWNKCH